MSKEGMTLKLTKSGFSITEKVFFGGNKVTSVCWRDVVRVDVFLWDVFTCHTLGFRLMKSDGDHFCANDDFKNRDLFKERMFQEFLDLDYQAIEKG